MLLKAHDGGAPRAATPRPRDMALIRLAYAADLPGPEEALKRLQAGEPMPGGADLPAAAAAAPGSGGMGGGGASAPRPRVIAPAAAAATSRRRPCSPSPTCIALIDRRRDIAPAAWTWSGSSGRSASRPGAIECEPAPGAPNNLAQRLVARLKEWTGQPWLIAAQGGGGRSPLGAAEARAPRSAPRSRPIPSSCAVMAALPGAEIISSAQPAATRRRRRAPTPERRRRRPGSAFQASVGRRRKPRVKREPHERPWPHR